MFKCLPTNQGSAVLTLYTGLYIAEGDVNILPNNHFNVKVLLQHCNEYVDHSLRS